MFDWHRLGLAAACMAVLLPLGCGKPEKQMLAQVKNKTITVADFQLALSNLPESYKSLVGTPEGKRKVLDNLIKKDLLVLEAERRGYAKDAKVQEKLRQLRAQAQTRLEKELAEVQERLRQVNTQVYETVLLEELNARLKQEGLPGETISDEDIAAYYSDYAKKLKLLNPAVVVPELAKVKSQIKSILIEEKLIQKLKEQNPAKRDEELFQKLYVNDAHGAAVIEEEKK